MIKNTTLHFLSALSLITSLASPFARAWGRHDLMTKTALEAPRLAMLQNVRLRAEPIDEAAPDLLQRVIPSLHQWAREFHVAFDTRYPWTQPSEGTSAFGRLLTPREALLWALEDNIKAPLDFTVTASDQESAPRDPVFGAPGLPREGTAAEVLSRFVEEPDALIDEGFNKAPYLDRFRPQMSLFYDDSAHTHTFRHYFVPSSLIPPLLTPRGIAPYRSALYARLAIGAFRTKHPYWGYRFLAWSVHYAQDTTQPWHTVFLPSISFLRLSKAAMRKEISALHFLTEAFADAWLQRMPPFSQRPSRKLASERGALSYRSYQLWATRHDDPWIIARLVEEAARTAHEKAAAFASAGRRLFAPMINNLDDGLKPLKASIEVGGIGFASSPLDFSGNGDGAARYLRPLWNQEFSLSDNRDAFAEDVAASLDTARELSQRIITYVLEEGGVAPQLSF